MSKFVKNEDAFTGLEAAIVLIAFIVVAAVFSYVMLGAGFFATQEAQRVVGTGVAQASSSVELSGPVIVSAPSTTSDCVGEIKFFLQLTAGESPVDMEKVTFTVATADDMKTFTYSDVEKTWYANGKEDESKDHLLEKFETVEIKIPGTAATKSLPAIKPNDRFTVEVKPDVGASFPINRVAPPDLRKNCNYEVY